MTLTKLKALDALIGRVREHPALYQYFIGDEPGAKNFPEMARLVDYLREKDPVHPAYINLFPTGATNEQLGTKGDTVSAYKDYLSRFVETVHPALLSYDHYQFAFDHDSDDYFLNISLVRRAAQDAGLPFLNIVQACTWRPTMRAPAEAEMRYLVYTTLAYGAQGISYYVYSHPGHTPGIADEDGKPTAVYHWLKPLNRDFSKIATEVQSLHSVGVYHAGMMPPGAQPLPKDATFLFDPPLPDVDFQPGKRVQGALLGMFGPIENGPPTHAIVVNVDYEKEQVLNLKGLGSLDRFDPATCEWNSTSDPRLKLRLPPGGGVLVRCRGEDVGFTPIFDGETLKGWKAPNMSYWSVQDGAITAESTEANPCRSNQYLVWQGGDVADFELKAKFRLADNQGNSGIQFRSRIDKNGMGIGYQADILPGGEWCGALADEYTSRVPLMVPNGYKTVVDANGKRTCTRVGEPVSLRKSGEWNNYHIVARGHHVILKINGQISAEFIDNDAKEFDASGILGLQLRSGPPMKVQFKEVLLRQFR